MVAYPDDIDAALAGDAADFCSGVCFFGILTAPNIGWHIFNYRGGE